LFALSVSASCCCPAKKEVEGNDPHGTSVIQKLLEDRDTPCLNILDLLGSGDYYVHDGHLNESGHAIAARAIYGFLNRYFLAR
jgi:hypothetical protein